MTPEQANLIRQAVEGAERTTGRTHVLWVMLFRLLVSWFRE